MRDPKVLKLVHNAMIDCLEKGDVDADVALEIAFRVTMQVMCSNIAVARGAEPSAEEALAAFAENTGRFLASMAQQQMAATPVTPGAPLH